MRTAWLRDGLACPLAYVKAFYCVTRSPNRSKRTLTRGCIANRFNARLGVYG